MNYDYQNPDNLTPEQIGDGCTCKGPRSHLSPKDWVHDVEKPQDDIIAYRVLKWKTSQKDYESFRQQSQQQEPAPTDNDAWNSLLTTNAQLGKKVAELESKLSAALEGVQMWKKRTEELEKYLAIRDERLEAAQARLEQLEWRPVSVKPTKEDALFGWVQITDGFRTIMGQISNKWDSSWTHWRPSTSPIKTNTERSEFQTWWKTNGVSGFPEEAAFDLWKSATGKSK